MKSTPSCEHTASATCHSGSESKPLWHDPWVWAPVSGLIVGTIGAWWPSMGDVGTLYIGYLQKVLGPFLLGLLIGGLVDHFVPKAYIVKWLSGGRKRVILRSTLLGFLASSCSHGCLALSLELYRKGASVPAAVSFLLASPWASLPLTLLLLGLFGLKGLIMVGLSLFVAWMTGLMFQQLDRRGLIESNPHTEGVDRDVHVWSDLVRRFREYPWTWQQTAQDARGVWQGMLPLGRMVLGWVQLGLVLSAVLGALVPHETFLRFLGPTVGGLLATLGVATVLEVCSEGTAPLAFELYRHTGALGNAFAFLMGGVITDYTELGAVWTNIGRRTVVWMLVVVLPMVLGLGFVLNALR